MGIIGTSVRAKVIGTLGEKELIAKVDTGATRSSIDAEIAAETGLGPIVSVKGYKSSLGKKRRLIVKGKIELCGKTIESEFSIANREHMKYPVLIGLDILRDLDVMIDPSIQGPDHECCSRQCEDKENCVCE
ncbi:MAG: hypothetical protein GOU99_00450 [Candidatus Altiarchaeota archaeon]|nr:hypothetical protein [Candidatus Altiarchaeota archaeon]